MLLKISKPLESLLSLRKVELLCSESELNQVAKDFSEILEIGDIVFLEGPLGAGKSTLARMLLDHLGADRPSEGSPTYPIAHEYQTRIGRAVHLDFYRLETEREVEDAGVLESLNDRSSLAFTEWASKFKLDLPEGYPGKAVYRVEIGFSDRPEQRSLTLLAH